MQYQEYTKSIVDQLKEAKDTIKEMEKVLKLFRGRYLEMGLAQAPEVVRCNKVLKKLKGEE